MRRAFVLTLAAVVALGVFFRVYHAGYKLYNPDEANTSLRLSGHTNRQLSAFLNDGALHAARELDLYAVPTAQTSPADIWRSLATEDPQHPPLFFLITYASERVTGDSVFFRRLPALVFGLSALWAAWWFGRELFGDPTPAWILTALVAVSPFHVAFSQEAREYSLFLLAICLSSALLLFALRTGARRAFVLYALCVSAALWSFTLFVLVAAAHALYLVAPVSEASARRRIAAGAALLAGCATIIPWLANLFAKADVAVADTAWQATALSAPLYAGKWLFNLGSVFFDLDYVSLAWLPVTLAALAVAFAACFVFFRRTGPRVWLLPVALGAIPLVATTVPDLLHHETRALQGRYLTALWLAVEIAAAGGFWLALKSARGARAAAWQAGLGFLFVCGVGSCAVSSQARTWWVTGFQSVRSLPAIIDALREVEAPTLVYIEDADDMLMLQPYGLSSLRFKLHPALDEAALRSEPNPYAILSSEHLSESPVATALRRVPVVETFEMRPDPAIDRLRRSGAAARKIDYGGRLDLGLYAPAEAATRPSP